MRVSEGLTALALSLAVAPAAQANDACREKFVACVQKTGDPTACFSVNNACEAQVTVDERRGEILQNVEIYQEAGDAHAAMTIENTSSNPVTIGVLSRDLTCPDGAKEEAFFVFNRALQPGETLRTTAGVVCFGQGGASVDAEDDAPIGGASVQSATIYCDLARTRAVTVTVLRDRLVRYERFDTQQGDYRIQTLDGADLVEEVCREPEAPDARRVEQAALSALRELTDWLNAHAPQPGASANGSSGIRH